MYTTAMAFLEALRETGVSHVFANLGSDHPALIESLAEARAEGVPMPRLITCPNEMVALSAAHGYAQATGQAQAVIVHVECGTQALAGAVHNAAKGRAPSLSCLPSGKHLGQESSGQRARRKAPRPACPQNMVAFTMSRHAGGVPSQRLSGTSR